MLAEVRSTVRSIPQEIPVGKKEGLARTSVVNFDNVHVVAKARLGERIGGLASSREREVRRAIGYALDWPELKVL